MKFDRRHLVGSVTLLLASVLYNVWVFWTPARKPAQTITAPAPAAANAATSGGPATIDPLKIPPPPRVDLIVAPEWTRDPFRGGVAAPPAKTTAALPAAAPAPETEPVVGAILISPERRLAIVDGHVAVVGDRIAIGTIVEIARDAIVIRKPSGDNRRYYVRELSK